ncbi:MAG: TraB/GumN family protein, partial [Pseudomonadota bacterium]
IQLVAGASALVLLAACNGADQSETAPASEPGTSGGQTDATTTGTAAAPEREDIPPFGEPPVWSVSDADTTVHLFGTVHILKPETEWKTDTLDTVLGEIDALYFEADVTSPQAAAEMARLVPQLGTFQDGTKLTDLLEPDELKEVEEAAALLGLPMAAIEPMKPWLATVQMSVLALQQQGYAADSGVETVLTGEANDRGIPLRYLESAAEQLNFFADLPLDDQVDFLVTSSVQIEDDPNMLDELVEEWAEGDVDDLAAMMAEPDVMGSAEVYDVLIVERNQNWTEQIKALLDAEEGTFMMAVGAAHLAGEDSVVEMLRSDGLEVDGP